MHVSELDYDLPPELIAQHPVAKRDASRLLVVRRDTGEIREDVFAHIAAYLRAGDCMVLNRTKVIRARLHGRKDTGGRVEVFLLRELAPGTWEALVRPSARVRVGSEVTFGPARATIGGVTGGGHRLVIFERADVLPLLEASGEVPLPPYIHRDHADATDLTRYQTIYAQTPGAVAAPTAGLHFTDEVFASLDRASVRRVSLTLHVGYGTFSPIRAENVEKHVLEAEEFDFPKETADTLNQTRAQGGRVVAVGTTSTRVLETQYMEGRFVAGRGAAATFIFPPYVFRAVDALQTNFHLPRSSLLALVYAFAGADLVREAYQYAIRERFRFYSYGDVMLII